LEKKKLKQKKNGLKEFVDEQQLNNEWKQHALLDYSASKRTPNFTHVEEKLLFELMDKHKRIIDNKKSGAVQWSDKEKAWKQLEEEFNGKNIVSTFRSMTI
jgi:hypothetical protein